eukprot:g2018.t1
MPAGPSIEIARAHARQNRFQGGDAQYCSTSIHSLGSASVGIGLYFRLLKVFTLYFFLASLLSVPVLVLNYVQSGLGTEQKDTLGFAQFSLGNQGVSDDDALSCKSSLNGTVAGVRDCNGTRVDVKLGGLIDMRDVSATSVAYTITLCDILYSACFLFLIRWLRRDIDDFVDRADAENLTGSDYAVFVRGLPSACTSSELRDHFAALYDTSFTSRPGVSYPMICGCLGKPRLLPSLADAGVAVGQAGGAVYHTAVQDVTHLGSSCDPAEALGYIGGAVAEVSVCRANGPLLRACLNSRELTKRAELLRARLERARNQAEMLGTAAAETAMKKAEARLEKLDRHVSKARGRVRSTRKGMLDGANFDDAGTNSVARKLLAKGPAVCAFVVFNSDVAAARCVDDYRTSHSSCARLCQPRSLRLRRSHALTVTRAAEPSDVLWENLELLQRPWEARLRRALSNLVTLLLLIVSATCIYAAQSAKNEFASKVPEFSLCAMQLPAVAFGRFGNDSANEASFVLDSNHSCPGKGAVSLRYSVSLRDDFPSNVINGDINNTASGLPRILAPARYSSALAPVGCRGPENIPLCSAKTARHGCVRDDDKGICCTLPCFHGAANLSGVGSSEACQRYDRSDIVACYCKHKMQEAIAEHGLIDGSRDLITRSPTCKTFATNFLYANGLVYAAAAAVVLVNTVLKTLLLALARFERHPSVSEEASSAATKIFYSMFLNTGIIAIIVNARLPPTISNPIPSSFKLLHGEFDSTTRKWYSVVGVAVCMTMLLNVFVPHIPLLVASVLKYGKQLYASTRCGMQGFTLQSELDEVYAGPRFEIVTRVPAILNTVFVTLMFCGGVPILLLFAFFAILLTLLIDKLAMLKFYALPPSMDEALAKQAVLLLPWCLLIHLGFSGWMYSDENLLKSGVLSPSLLGQGNVDSDSEAAVVDAYNQFLADMKNGSDPLGVVGRSVRYNVFPFALWCVILLLWLVLDATAGRILRPVLSRLLAPAAAAWSCGKRCCIRHCTKRRKQVLPGEVAATGLAVKLQCPVTVASANPDLTAPFSIPTSANTQPTEAQKKAGWRFQWNAEKGWHKFKLDTKTGQKLRTWQMIPMTDNTPGHSYDIEKNPKYADALALLDMLPMSPAKRKTHASHCDDDMTVSEVRPAEAVA